MVTGVPVIANVPYFSRMALPVKHFGRRPRYFVMHCSAVSRATLPRQFSSAGFAVTTVRYDLDREPRPCWLGSLRRGDAQPVTTLGIGEVVSPEAGRGNAHEPGNQWRSAARPLEPGAVGLGDDGFDHRGARAVVRA